MRDCLVRQRGRAGRLVGGRAGTGLLDPVVGNALRAVGDSDRAALAESKGFERASHWSVVIVGVAAQVVCVLGREREDRPTNAVPAHRRHTVNHVVVGIGMPSTVDLGIGFVRPRRKGKHCERSFVVGYKETVSARDVFLSVNPARVSVRPLSRIPIRLHERPGMRIGTLDEIEVFRGRDSNLHVSMIGGIGNALVLRAVGPMGGISGPSGGESTRLVAVLAPRPDRHLRG